MLGAARAALARLDAMGIQPRRLVLYSESIGTATATRMAIEHPAADLILESPYTSMLDLARLRFWFLPIRLLLTDRFEQLADMPKVRVPLLVLLGARDEIVPPDMGHAVFDAASQHKELWVAHDGGHDDLAAHGAIDRAIAFANDMASDARAMAQPARRGHHAISHGMEDDMPGSGSRIHRYAAAGILVLAALTSNAASQGDQGMLDGRGAARPDALRRAIEAELGKERDAEGLGPAYGDGIDISAAFGPYIARGTSEGEAIRSLRSADLTVLPAPAGEGMETLTATATLGRDAYTTTRVIVVLVMERDRGGTNRVARLSASLSWSAL